MGRSFSVLIIVILIGFDLFTSFTGRHEYHHAFPRQYFGSQGDDATVRLRYFDHKFVHSSSSTFDSVWRGTGKDSYDATYNRKAALACGTGVINYNILAYDYHSRLPDFPWLWASKIDGISTMLYHISYIMSVPAKLIHGTKHILLRGYGFMDFVWLVSQLAVGVVYSICLFFPSLVIGSICNPIDTLVNIMILPVTLFDFAWGGVIKPILNIVLCFF